MKKILLNSWLLFLGALIALPLYSQEETADTIAKTGNVFKPSEILPPRYVGGEQAMFKFLDSVLVVPKSAIKEGVSGRVIVRFFVDKEGVIKSPSIQQGLTPECNEAAMEAVKKMPLWEPAKQNGKNINGFAVVPVSFKTKIVTYEYQATEAELTYDQYVLPDKKWVLIKIGEEDIPENIPQQPYFTLTVDKKKRRIIEGNGSCADFSGRYNWNMKNWKLSFSKVEPKKKKCKGKKIKVIDSDVLSILKNTQEYRITQDGYLQVGKKDKNRFVPIATFEQEQPKGKKK